jgi:hypothetical protein
VLQDVEFKKSGVVCVYRGDTSISDIVAAVKAVGAYENLESLKFVIHDLSDINSFSFCERALIELAAYALGILYTNEKLKSCLVTTDSVALKACNSYSNISKRTMTKFENMVDATQWAFAITAA